jgi:hypothetical protein
MKKNRGDIRSSRLATGGTDTGGRIPPVSTTPVANLLPAENFATSFTRIVDTGGKFAAGVNGTSA